MRDEHLTRQFDLIPDEILGTPITIVGAGAIGSWTTLALAKMGFTDITVYDFDTVDIVNMNSQFYGLEDVGDYKTSTLFERIFAMTEVQIKTMNEIYTTKENRNIKGILISAVDSMAARRDIWESVKNKAIQLKAVIDPRMGAEEALLYCMNPMDERDQESYAKTLYSDEEALQERCTAKATAYTALMLSGLVAKTVKDVLTGNHIRTAQWSIKNDQFLAWTRDKKRG
jgi:molybdopterin/thiamine biosynthesis adenylyltransferase